MARQPHHLVEQQQALGRYLAAFREAAGLYQSSIARAVPCHRTTVSHAEAGSQLPDSYFWETADQVVGANGALLAAYDDLIDAKAAHTAEQQATRRKRAQATVQTLTHFTSPEPSIEQRADRDRSAQHHQTDTPGSVVAVDPGQARGMPGVVIDVMKRRTFAMGLAATTAGAFGVTWTGGKIGRADVEGLRHAASRLHALDQQHGGETLWKAAGAWVAEGYLMLEQNTYTSSVGQQLLMATTRLQVCAGWLAFDAGQHEMARTRYNDAVVLARQANDAETEIRALALLALQSNVLGQPREARRLALASASVAGPAGGSPRLVAIPQLRHAVASSLTAETREADRCITEARKALEVYHDGPTEEWCTFLDSAEIDAVEATCAIELGRLSRAEVLLERAIANYGDRHARNRALYRLRLGHVRLDMGAVDGAAATANEALDDLSLEVASWRVSGELESLASRLGEYPSVDGVDQFLVGCGALSR